MNYYFLQTIYLFNELVKGSLATFADILKNVCNNEDVRNSKEK